MISRNFKPQQIRVDQTGHKYVFFIIMHSRFVDNVYNLN